MQGNELLIIDSIIAGVEGTYTLVMDNAKAKAQGEEFFAILISLKAEHFIEGTYKDTVDNEPKTLRIQSIVNMVQKSIASASDHMRTAFRLKLMQFLDAVESGAPNELILRFRKQLRRAYSAAFDDNLASDQKKLDAAFETVTKLSKTLNIASRTESVDRFKHLAEQIAAAKEAIAIQQQQELQNMQYPEDKK